MSRTTILDGVEPPDIGLPDKFPLFRQVQREMVDYALYGPAGDGEAQRFTALGAPAGSGKSLGGEAIGRTGGKRIVTLTATRSLQDQRVEDFEVADVRGRSNYQCEAVTIKDKGTGKDKPVNCEVGADYACHIEGSIDCPYTAAVEAGSWGESVSTNYQWWLNARSMNALSLEKAGPVGMLICDEAHLAVDETSRFLSTYLPLDDIFTFAGIAKGEQKVPWRGKAEEWGRVDEQWAQVLVAMQVAVRRERQQWLDAYDGVLRNARKNEKFRHADRLLKELTKLTRHGSDGNWIWQLGNKGVQFDVVWPRRYTERYLFSNVPKVVLMSATLRPKLLGLLGLKRSEVDFREWPRQFPAVLAPVYYLPGPKLTWRSSNEDLGHMVKRVDDIIAARPGRRALIHTHSYKRAEWLQAHSRYGKFMILNASGAGYRGGGGMNAQQAADKYRKTQPTAEHPAILVGPSFTTGWDFPLCELETNIITKIPWPDLSSPIMKARAEDEGYASYVTMQDLVQACGRGQRTEVDRCENWILDGGIENFQHYAKVHAPQWWRVRKVEGIPKEPVKL